MPFENHHGNRSFSLISIYKNAPAASGVYGISNAREWLYIGETDNIQAELVNHLQQPDPFLAEKEPSGFTYELDSPERRLERQRQLIFELRPIGNRRAARAPA
ncbi:MAG TPA: hypothetical protein VME43_13740 [Bryobacteraceae bacterium]|nr:hypothetical protein [Bryobacteraceae bacterium]